MTGRMPLASIAAIISCCSWREPTVMPLIATFLDIANAVGISPAIPVNAPIAREIWPPIRQAWMD